MMPNCNPVSLGEVMLDKESGKFEMDTDGNVQFYPSDHLKEKLNKWMAAELLRAAENHQPLFDCAVQNIESYSLTQKALPGPDGRDSILPSAIARNPADKKIATTVNNILRPPQIITFDAYFDAEIDVAVPVKVGDLMAQGQPMMGPDGVPLDPESEIAAPLRIDAETLARRFSQRIEFLNRERMNFGRHLHKLVQSVISGAKPATYWLVSWKKTPRNVFGPKSDRVIDFDPTKREDVYQEQGGLHWEVLPFHNVLRPNLDDKINDLEWIARRDGSLQKPDDILRAFKAGDLPLVKDEDHARKLRNCTVVTIEEKSKEKLDSSVKRYRPQIPTDCCDTWYVEFYAWLKAKNPETGESETRRFSLEGAYHLGAQEFMSIIRKPYNHQRRCLVDFVEYIDGMSTVELVKRNANLDTHLTHSEVMRAYKAAHPPTCYDPDNHHAVQFFGNRTTPVPPDMPIPVPPAAWDTKRSAFDFPSLLPMIQWNTGLAQGAAKSSEYEQGERVVSHTSPQTVGMMLERGGEEQRLFLRLLNDGIAEVMRLSLETLRQYEPLGGEIPIKDPASKAISMVPFFYPVEDVLDNFRITLTAADESTSRERSPQERMAILQGYMEWTTWVANVAQPLLTNPDLTPEDRAVYQQMIAGGQALWSDAIAAVRTDERKFQVADKIDAAVAARDRQAEMMSMQAAQQAAMQQLMQGGATNAQGQPPNGNGPVAADAGGGPGGPPQPGVEPGMGAGGPNAMGGGMPPGVM